MDADPAQVDNNTTPVGDHGSGVGVTLWVAGMSAFIVRNYQSSMPFWPAPLLETSFSILSLIHAVSGMLFAGTIITTTLLEWIVVASKDKAVNQFWFQHAPGVEKAFVLPGLTGSIVSGIAQAFQSYGSLNHAPLHVKSAVHLLALFGVWWGATDRATQSKAYQAAMETNDPKDDSIPAVMIYRRVSNLVSCAFLMALYAVMVLKPGLGR